jgi:hypothetical protein
MGAIFIEDKDLVVCKVCGINVHFYEEFCLKTTSKNKLAKIIDSYFI